MSQSYVGIWTCVPSEYLFFSHHAAHATPYLPDPFSVGPGDSYSFLADTVVFDTG